MSVISHIAPASQAQPSYHPIRRAGPPEEWVVASGTPDNPSPALLYGFKTEQAAKQTADTLNKLRAGKLPNRIAS